MSEFDREWIEECANRDLEEEEPDPDPGWELLDEAQMLQRHLRECLAEIDRLNAELFDKGAENWQEGTKEDG